MSIAKRILDNPSRDVVVEAFDIRIKWSMIFFTSFCKYLHQEMSSPKSCDIYTQLRI